MTKDEITHMSYGCGKDDGDILSWVVVKKKMKGKFQEEKSSICNQHNGLTLVMRANPVIANERAAAFVSPWLPKSEKSFGKCLRFKYKMVGRGVKSLKIYQETPHGFERQPIWVDFDGAGLSSSSWHYGQTSISATSILRLSIVGELEGKPGYLAFGGVVMSHETYCSPQPSTAQKACRQTLTSSLGFIVSPLYPGYYPNNVTCSWHVIAKESHIIRLHFQSFAVEPHPTCANDYVEVRDGGNHVSRNIGRYCGHTYPLVIESSSNTLTIIFRANEAGIYTGFKANYTTKPGKRTFCIEDCPRGCTCAKLPGSDVMVLVE